MREERYRLHARDERAATGHDGCLAAQRGNVTGSRACVARTGPREHARHPEMSGDAARSLARGAHEER